MEPVIRECCTTSRADFGGATAFGREASAAAAVGITAEMLLAAGGTCLKKRVDRARRLFAEALRLGAGASATVEERACGRLANKGRARQGRRANA
jgi:hypothetical protein